ncbi:'Cold-shock' DNA-binding domain protein [Luminiphilus syltensis NOR5-1B]|uniref:'Cold-shock' DNA-binding domain protein n=2 Tax=Luminiphilus TaxID=1341118 RepID=B8KR01_9GAMM|nr:'Cold-shock' DNA-binding domain protein [Luminiphilus syltensis NOR5-1B]
MVFNVALAIAVYFALTFLPAFSYNWLVGLLVVAIVATLIGNASITVPATVIPAGTGTGTKGSIKWFNATKGFGFITGDDGNEVFVHFRNVEQLSKREIKPGQRVAYRVTETERGPQAEDVSPL